MAKCFNTALWFSLRPKLWYRNGVRPDPAQNGSVPLVVAGAQHDGGGVVEVPVAVDVEHLAFAILHTRIMSIILVWIELPLIEGLQLPSEDQGCIRVHCSM